MITVRKLTPEDAEEYRRCRIDALRESPSAFLSSFEEEEDRTVAMMRERLEKQQASQGVTFAAFDGERAVGLTGIFREERLQRRHKMYIVSVYVRPEHRGTGIGHALVQAAIDYARTVDGVSHVELSVSHDNTAAKALYATHGFISWGIEPHFKIVKGVAYDEENMSLRL
jgi:RimJ/RimL family protein N-acetyltransferase